MRRLVLLVVAVGALSACPPPVDPDAVEVCKEFIDRIFAHLDSCELDTAEARADLEQEINCDLAVEIQGDPIACAAAFEQVDCADVSVESVNATIGNCDGEILVLAE